jgi:hypothetical protein
MTGPTFEDLLGDWIKDGPDRAPTEVLQSVLATYPTTRQRWGIRRTPWRLASMNLFSRALAGVAVAVAVVAVGVFVISRPGPGGVGGVATPPVAVVSASPSADVSASPAPTPSPSAAIATPSPTASPTASPTPTPTPTPALALCASTDLSARITLWEGAAGSRIAHVDLTNDGSTRCQVATLDKPQLLGGYKAILIDGTHPASPATIKLDAGSTLTTLVQTANYCGADPVAPVTIAFVRGDGSRVVAAPESATDTTVPPCNGPGQPGQIDMHPWAP